MKLLFDQNLSFRLCADLADLFPQSSHVRLVGLAEADDRAIWAFARLHDFAITSQDVDFAEMAALYGPPPKVIWIRTGNQPRTPLQNCSANMRDYLQRSLTTTQLACRFTEIDENSFYSRRTGMKDAHPTDYGSLS